MKTTAPNEPVNLLVLVHPGSACGSANFNIGKLDAGAAREALISTLQSWQGGILVIDGELSDELPFYPSLDRAIKNALSSAVEHGQISRRVEGDDPDQMDRIREFVQEMPELQRSAHFEVTGAWYHPEDGGGCVGSVLKELERMGCRATLSDSAVTMDFEVDDEDLEMSESNVARISSAKKRGPRR